MTAITDLLEIPKRKTALLLVVLSYWLITGAACDTFLEAEGTITLQDQLSEQYQGKKIIGIWAIEAATQSENTSMPGGDLCESIGITCSVVLQGIDVSYTLEGEDETPVLDPDPNDVIIVGQTDYPFKLNNIYGQGEASRFSANYIGAFIDDDNDGQWGMNEPLGWAIENPLSRSCVDRRHSDHVNCLELSVPIN